MSGVIGQSKAWRVSKIMIRSSWGRETIVVLARTGREQEYTVFFSEISTTPRRTMDSQWKHSRQYMIVMVVIGRHGLFSVKNPFKPVTLLKWEAQTIFVSLKETGEPCELGNKTAR
jgi:hypothetical protein